MPLKRYRRDHPRIATELHVELVLPDRAVIHASTVNVSRAGFQVHADRATVEALFPHGGRPAPGERVAVEARLRVPRPGAEPAVLAAGCEAVFSRRVAENEYRIGLHFSRMQEADEALLDAYVDGA